jgi:hypothetical protein
VIVNEIRISQQTEYFEHKADKDLRMVRVKRTQWHESFVPCGDAHAKIEVKKLEAETDWSLEVRRGTRILFTLNGDKDIRAIIDIDCWKEVPYQPT